MMDLGLLPVLTGMALLGATTDPSVSGDMLCSADQPSRLILTTEETQALESARGVDGGRKWLKYGLIGACAGGVTGAVFGYFAKTETCSEASNVGPGCEVERHTLAFALIGLSIGGAGGVLIGLREDRLPAH